MAFSCLYVINLWRKAVVNVSEKWWLSGAEFIVVTHLWKRRKHIRVVSWLSVVVDIELGLQKAKDMNEIFDMPLIHNAGNCQIYLFSCGSPWSQLSEISTPQSVLSLPYLAITLIERLNCSKVLRCFYGILLARNSILCVQKHAMRPHFQINFFLFFIPIHFTRPTH